MIDRNLWRGVRDMWRLRHSKTWPRKRRLDRLYFEYILLPRLRRDTSVRRVLTIGVAAFTQHYYPFFDNHAKVHSIDVDPAMQQYGARDRHSITSSTELARLYRAGSFDAVLMNGVYGWGLNDEVGLCATLRGILHVLQPDGLLIFGWDRNARHDPLMLDRINVFSDFRRSSRLGPSRRELPSRHKCHVFDVYEPAHKAACIADPGSEKILSVVDSQARRNGPVSTLTPNQSVIARISASSRPLSAG